MKNVFPNLEWYSAISTAKGMFARCPFAAAARCPRFYQSLYLLGHAGSTRIGKAEDKKLEAFWKTSDLWPVTHEQATAVSGPPDGPKAFTHFCPEVLFERFGLFASDLFPYSDTEAKENAHAALAASGITSQRDWRWYWWQVHELHYSECSLFSLLPYSSEKKNSSEDEQLIEMKPSVGGFRLNLKVLFTRLARWWLRKRDKK